MVEARIRRASPAVIRVRVTPNARANKLVGFMEDGVLKVKLAAPAVEGAANKALLSFLAKTLNVRVRDLEIMAGHAGREKLITVTGVDPEAVTERLRTSLQR